LKGIQVNGRPPHADQPMLEKGYVTIVPMRLDRTAADLIPSVEEIIKTSENCMIEKIKLHFS
ncbi:MAG: hypothetical protein IJP03_05930, partial [Christensenellaceae bacterium]|nr:hypothetical protein [Christensenellaceae bacterium]